MVPHRFGLLPEDLARLLQEAGQPCTLDEARRVQASLLSLGRADGGGVRPVSSRVNAALQAYTRWEPLRVLERVPDEEDGSLRYLFESGDGAVFEAVRIPLEQPGRFTLCLSSQVGCGMACDFCATGRIGLRRDLEPWEMVAQWWTARAEAPGRISGAVFMGQGEPLHNYEAVMQAARVLSDPCGGRIARDAITVSTVGLVAQIRRYTDETQPWRLIVSLSSAVPERRARLLPVAGRVQLDKLVEALSERAARSGERVTLAWVLLGGVNTGPDELDALAQLSRRLPIRLNLIDVNDLRPHGYRRATDEERERFLDGLAAARIPFVRRFSVGRGQRSACGMLAGERMGV